MTNSEKKKDDIWYFWKKGTVAEPWPTAEQLWKDPKVKKIIEWHKNLDKKKVLK